MIINIAKKIAMPVAVFLSLGATAASAHVKLDTDSGFKIYDSGSPYRYLQLSGTLNLDEVMFTGRAKRSVAANSNYSGIDGYKKDASMRSGADLRRADVAIDIGIMQDVEAGVYLHWNSKKSNLGLTDAYLAYTGFKNMKLSFGDVSMPYALEGNNSTQTIPFMERSLAVNSFSPDTGLGAKINAWNSCAAVTAAIAHNGDSTSTYGSDRLVTGARATFAPINSAGRVYHFGVTAIHQEIDQRGQTKALKDMGTYAQFKANAEMKNKQTTLSLLDTGRLRAKSFQVYGLEAAVLMGPVLLQGDYLRNRVHGSGELHKDSKIAQRNESYTFTGYHVQASYFLTGEVRPYVLKSGKFGSVTPNSAADGAWEVATRYSHLDLNDKNLRGGKASSVTLALNYYFNKNIRVVTNFIRSDITPSAEVFDKTKLAKRTVNAVGMRLQIKL